MSTNRRATDFILNQVLEAPTVRPITDRWSGSVAADDDLDEVEI